MGVPVCRLTCVLGYSWPLQSIIRCRNGALGTLRGMFSIDPATTRDVTLAEVTERLARKASVQALVTIGSTRDALQSAYSDYDLVIVLQGWPAEVRIGYTTI